MTLYMDTIQYNTEEAVYITYANMPASNQLKHQTETPITDWNTYHRHIITSAFSSSTTQQIEGHVLQVCPNGPGPSTSRLKGMVPCVKREGNVPWCLKRCYLVMLKWTVPLCLKGKGFFMSKENVPPMPLHVQRECFPMSTGNVPLCLWSQLEPKRCHIYK